MTPNLDRQSWQQVGLVERLLVFSTLSVEMRNVDNYALPCLASKMKNSSLLTVCTRAATLLPLVNSPHDRHAAQFSVLHKGSPTKRDHSERRTIYLL